MKFGRLTDLIKNSKALTSDRALHFSFKDKSLQDFAIELNTDEQLFNEGTDRDGRVIGQYSGYTEALNAGKTFAGKRKIAGENWFFYDTGDLFRSFFVKISADGITINATDVDKLEDVMNEDPSILVGLTEKNKSILAHEALPRMREYIINRLLK